MEEIRIAKCPKESACTSRQVDGKHSFTQQPSELCEGILHWRKLTGRARPATNSSFARTSPGSLGKSHFL